jgi:small-conductance mechanosensitive channel
VIFALIIILPILEINATGILVAGGIIALIIGLATQSIIANLVAGMFLMLERPVKIGDSIKVDNETGVVEDIRVMSTRVRTFDGLYIRIPNETIFTSNITNYSVNIVRRFELVFGIGYEDDANMAMDIVKKQIEDAPFALVNPSPTIFVEQLAESTVNIKARVWAPQSEWFDVKTELIWKIKEALEAEGISLPAPQREIMFKNKPVLA